MYFIFDNNIALQQVIFYLFIFFSYFKIFNLFYQKIFFLSSKLEFLFGENENKIKINKG